MGVYPVNPVRLLMKTVKAELILNIEQDENTAGNSDSQTGNIQKRVHFVPDKVPHGYLEIILKHGNLL
jgi:hypothetical protein